MVVRCCGSHQWDFERRPLQTSHLSGVFSSRIHTADTLRSEDEKIRRCVRNSVTCFPSHRELDAGHTLIVTVRSWATVDLHLVSRRPQSPAWLVDFTACLRVRTVRNIDHLMPQLWDLFLCQLGETVADRDGRNTLLWRRRPHQL